MKALEEIRNHPLYLESYDRLQQAESDRVFCCHNMVHFLDVARIAWILNLEQDLGIRKEVVYAAALLHDIGKYRQYEEGIPHEIASAEIAGQILEELPEMYFAEEEKREIIQAILGHRKLQKEAKELERILYHADKKSRACFACPAESECNWSMEKKNMEIEL